MAPALKNCLFCGLAKKMTSEHVWGEWTKGYVQRTANKHNHANVFVPRPGEPEAPNVRIRAGDHLDAQVHIVCAECNSGVLSQIQNDAKPTLIGLFKGTNVTLDLTAQQLVATWIAMATMTGEYLSQDDARVAVPQPDRTWLIDKRTPPQSWCIWIGHYPSRENSTQWVKASFPVIDADEVPPDMTGRDLAPTLQTTAFSVGNLFAFAMSCHFSEIPRGWDWRTAPKALRLLQPIWPTKLTSVDWPPPPMSDDDASSFSTAVVRYYEDFAKRLAQKRV